LCSGAVGLISFNVCWSVWHLPVQSCPQGLPPATADDGGRHRWYGGAVVLIYA
jgi:hypothetical protein